MKFCKHCGTQIPDDALCNCPGAVAERQAQGNVQPRQLAYQPQPQAYQPYQPQPQPQPYQGGPYGQPPQPYGQPPQPYGQPPRQGNGFGKKLFEPFKLYFREPCKAVTNRQKDRDIATPLIYIAVLFTVMIGVCSCIYGSHASKGVLYPGAPGSVSGMVRFNFATTLLAAFLLTLGMATAYVGARFLILLICGKKPVNVGALLLDSLISFGVNSIVPMAILLLGGLCYLLSSTIGWMFFAFAAVWYIAAGLTETAGALDPQKNAFIKLLVIAGIIGAFLALFLLLYRGMFIMNVKAATYLDMASDLVKGYSDLYNKLF